MSPHEFIRQEYDKRRELNENFSLRAFARWLRISPAQLSQMMAGKRAVTPKTFNKIASRVGLSPSERRQLITQLLEQKSGEKVAPPRRTLALKDDEFKLIADWYHFAILSLTKLPGAKADPRWIAAHLGIKAEDANLAVTRLERMGLIQTKPTFKQISDPLDVVSDVPSSAIRKYHAQNLQLAAEKLESVPVEERQYQSISFPIQTDSLPALKKLIDRFLQEASDQYESAIGHAVYHLNVQLFPVTRPKGKLK